MTCIDISKDLRKQLIPQFYSCFQSVSLFSRKSANKVSLLLKKLLSTVIPACGQMRKRIEQIVMDSFGDQFYEKALDCLKCLREQCIKVGIEKTTYDPVKSRKNGRI